MEPSQLRCSADKTKSHPISANSQNMRPNRGVVSGCIPADSFDIVGQHWETIDFAKHQPGLWMPELASLEERKRMAKREKACLLGRSLGGWASIANMRWGLTRWPTRGAITQRTTFYYFPGDAAETARTDPNDCVPCVFGEV